MRQWPQMDEIVRTSRLVADVEGNFPELTLEVGRRLQLDDVVVVEWTCNYGDGRLYRNVTIGELEDGQAVRVTDYWGEPTDDTAVATAADRSTRHARRRHLARRRTPRPLLGRGKPNPPASRALVGAARARPLQPFERPHAATPSGARAPSMVSAHRTVTRKPWQ